MRETGTTQTELARMSGVRQPSISQMLSGRIALSEAMLRRLLSCMGRGLEVRYRPVEPEISRSAKRSWVLHRQLSRHLDRDALVEWTPLIRRNLERLRDQTQGEPHLRNLDRWQRLVSDGDLPGLRRVLVSLDDDTIQMREVSPLAGLLSQDERKDALRKLP